MTGDRLGAALGTFCALTPIADEPALHEVLAGWNPRTSPFGRIAGTHFARLVVLPAPERQVARQPAEAPAPPLLMASAFFDGEPGAWLDRLCEAMPDEADAAWRCCEGHPGHPREHGHAFRAWLARHRVPATAIFGAYPDATLDEVRSALAFRERFRAFAFDLEARRHEHAAAFATFAAGPGA